MANKPLKKPLKRLKTTSVLVVLAFVAVTLLFSAAVLGTTDYTAGDVNNDGKIDVQDVVMVNKHVLGLQFPPLTQVELLAADINGDGVINVSDVVEIMKISLGLTDSYPMPIISLNDAVVRVPINTALADINLPSTVEANFAGGIKRNISVRWERVSTPAYNPFVFDEYTFKGDIINLPQGVRNPAELRATAKVSFLLRDPWPFPGEGYTLNVMLRPSGGGTVSGAGIYAAGARVTLTATPNAGYSFVRWTDEDGTTISNSRSFTYNMPAANKTLTAVFESGQAWDPRIDGAPVIFSATFLTTVNVYILPEYIDQVTSVTILGLPALQDSQDPRRWHRAFSQPVTLPQLAGQIIVYPEMLPGSQQLIDVSNSRALYDVLPGGSGLVTVSVAIRPNQILNVTRVMANGVELTEAPDYGSYYGTLLGLAPGNSVTVTAFSRLGTDIKYLTVQVIQ